MNYQKELDKLIERLERQEMAPSLIQFLAARELHHSDFKLNHNQIQEVSMEQVLEEAYSLRSWYFLLSIFH